MGFQKDQSQLEGVSKLFTEETLKDILSVMCNGKNVEVLGWDFGEASAKGDSYLSTVNRIKIQGNVDGVEKEASIVVKSLPQNMGRRKTFRSTEFFGNETIVYTEIFSKFTEFLHSKGQSHVLSVPKLVASVSDGENDFIALEDVSVYGYGPICRQNSVDFNQCSLILKTMARFHAISFAYKDQKKEEFSQMKDKLFETYFSDKQWSWYKRFHNKLVGIATDAVSKEYPGSLAEKKYTSVAFGDLFTKAVDFCGRKEAPTSTISQGDAWAPNFLARKSDEGEEALMLDFQLARCASPVLDLSFCVYACTDKQLRDEHFDDMLKLYYDELTNTITLLGSDPEKLYTWDTFMKEVKEQFVFGMVFAMEAIPFTILDESEAFDLDTLIKGDEKQDIADVWLLGNIKSQSGRRRLADVIAHTVEKGFF